MLVLLVLIALSTHAKAEGPVRDSAGARAIAVAARELTITAPARQAARTTLRLPAPVTMPDGCVLSDRSRFRGTALHTAIGLTPLPLSATSHVTWIVRSTLGGRPQTFDSECRGGTLPAGDYLLQIVHSPGTASIILELPGLTGRAQVRPVAADGSAIAQLTPVLDTAARPSTMSWGTAGSWRDEARF